MSKYFSIEGRKRRSEDNSRISRSKLDPGFRRSKAEPSFREVEKDILDSILGSRFWYLIQFYWIQNQIYSKLSLTLMIWIDLIINNKQWFLNDSVQLDWWKSNFFIWRGVENFDLKMMFECNLCVSNYQNFIIDRNIFFSTEQFIFLLSKKFK